MKKPQTAIPNTRLTRARQNRGWSQQYVAQQLGVARYYISRWERGVITPMPHYRRQLCELFQMDLHELGFLPSASIDEPAKSVTSTYSSTQASLEPCSSKEASPSEMQPIWQVPVPRNPFFTGREDILTQIADYFHEQEEQITYFPLALTGQGGIGKTHTAIEYAYRSVEHYQAVCWLRAETRELLTSDLAELASVLELPQAENQNQQQKVKQVQRWLQDHDRWLLILDNITDLHLLPEVLPTRHQGHILFTTQQQSVGTLAHHLSLDIMTQDEGVLLLLHRSGLLSATASVEQVTETERETAVRLTHLLGGLPLALDQVGAYIEETGCSLEKYLTLYQEHRTALLARRGRHSLDHPGSVFTTLSLSLERAGRTHPAATALLTLCAFLQPDAIPEELLAEGLRSLDPDLGPCVSSSLAFENVLATLRLYSLVHRDAQARTLSIHRLVQAVLLDQLDHEVQRKWAEYVVHLLYITFPNVDIYTRDWLGCQRLLPHAWICASFIQQWDLTSTEAEQVLYRLGCSVHELAEYDLAQSLFEQILTIQKRTYGTMHLYYANALHSIAEVSATKGEYEEAEAHYLKVIEIQEHLLGLEHPEIAQSLNDLAIVYRKRGKFSQAEQCHKRALAIREQSLGPEHPDVGMSLNNLALLYNQMGNFIQAEIFYQRALTIREKSLGAKHWHVAITQANFGKLYLDLGKLEQAEPLLQKSLEIRQKTFGVKHPYVAFSLTGLATLYQKQRRYKLAEQMHLQALEIRRQFMGTEHADTAHSLYELAQLYTEQGKYIQAEPLYQQALAIQQQILGSEHPDVAATLEGYAALLEKMQREDEALPLHQQARAIRTSHNSIRV